MIEFISTEQTLPIRNVVLREGRLSPDECVFPGDEEEGSFHLGYYHQGELVCIATFHKRNHPDFQGAGYQLRGMATKEGVRGRGFGNKLVNFGIVFLRGKQANYIWCNARKVAYRFYEQLGFEFVSDEFEVAGIGPHKTMYLKIQ